MKLRTGEKWILGISAALILWWMGKSFWALGTGQGRSDPGIPYYSTASPELRQAGSKLYEELDCRNCHSLWTLSNPFMSVPAPKLDGIGSLRRQEWLYNYFSAEDPQEILPSRLKKQYQMPSYAHLPKEKRRLLAAYMASLKVEDWYLEETKKAEYEALTGQKLFE